jgi:hypothetical protein
MRCNRSGGFEVVKKTSIENFHLPTPMGKMGFSP